MIGASKDELRRFALAMKDGFGEFQITDRAAALTYYGFLSLFPLLLVGVALLALFGSFPETYNSILNTLEEAAPGAAIETVDSALKGVLQDKGSASALLGVGLLTTFISASGALGAAMRAVEAIHEVDHSPSFIRAFIERLGLLLTVMTILFVAFASLVVAGPLFQSIADEAGVGDTATTVIAFARWPVGLIALMGAILMIYYRGAEFSEDEWSLRDLLPGAMFATVLWLIASVGFTFYVSNFGSYDATYGALGAVIVLLVWMWVGNNAILAGSLFNVERRRVFGHRMGYGGEDEITVDDRS